MDFSWIKRLFKIKSSTNGSDTGISTIDTSFIKVPNLSDLSKENQDKVMEYFNEIKYDSYETIVKYSDSLLKKSNKEIDFFVHDLEDSVKNIFAILKEVNKDNYFKLLLYREEIKLSIEVLNKIEEEAEFRLIALDTYIKKEERRKYDFLGIFGKAERLRYLSDKSSLLNERQRLLITIKLNKQHLQIIYNSLNENKDLLEQIESYIVTAKQFDTKYCDARISMVYASELLLLKRSMDNNNCSKLEKIEKDSAKYLNTMIAPRMDGINTEEFEKMLSSFEYKKVIQLFAQEDREIKQYAYEHRNDYQKIITEIKTVVNKYENSPSNTWNLDELYDIIRKLWIRINKYCYLCEKYLSDNIINEIINNLLNLYYYKYIMNGKLFSDKRITPRMEIPKEPVPRKGEFNVFLIPFDIRDKIDMDREIVYYNNISRDLLKKIEDKYGLKMDFSLLNQINKNRGRNKENELKYLNDVLNENFAFLDSFYIELLKDKNGLVLLLKKLLKNDYQQIAFDEVNNTCKKYIENMFYLLKFYHIQKYDMNELYNIFLNNVVIENLNFKEKGELEKLIFKCFIRKLEQEYDDRILVIPDFVKGFTKTIHIAIENKIGVYISNLTVAISINEFLKINKEHNIKYLFINENIYKELNKNNVIMNTKVIVVPNDIKYSELSSYLDRELEIEKCEKKVLSKTI